MCFAAKNILLMHTITVPMVLQVWKMADVKEWFKYENKLGDRTMKH